MARQDLEVVVDWEGGEMLEGAQEAIGLAIKYTAMDLLQNISQEAPVDTGRLRGSWAAEPVGGDLAWRVHTSVEYASFVHEGTGVYGPEGQPITPVRAAALVFYWKKIGQKVAFKGDLHSPIERRRFASWAKARGMRPFFTWPAGREADPYVERSIEWTSQRSAEFARRAVKEAIGGTSW